MTPLSIFQAITACWPARPISALAKQGPVQTSQVRASTYCPEMPPAGAGATNTTTIKTARLSQRYMAKTSFWRKRPRVRNEKTRTCPLLGGKQAASRGVRATLGSRAAARAHNSPLDRLRHRVCGKRPFSGLVADRELLRFDAAVVFRAAGCGGRLASGL